jgi:8-oxo-dGTP pyrophosphatase MutT (NUDIX family)
VAPAAAADLRPGSGVDAAYRRVLARLHGTRPDGPASVPRLAPGVSADVDARLRPLLPSAPAAAAVLVGFTEGSAGPGILLTVRATSLRQHAGQISFPGGRIDAGDAGPAAAALREAAEEIGLPGGEVAVAGFLPDHLSMTGYRVTPVVGRIAAGFVPRPDPAEVSAAFELPFASVLDESLQRTRVRSLAGVPIEVRDIHHGGHVIWGLTAAILLSLRELADD